MAGWMTDRLAHGDDKVASVCDCEPLASLIVVIAILRRLSSTVVELGKSLDLLWPTLT